MKNEFKMPLFAAPVSPVKDSLMGRVSRPATIHPSREATLQKVIRLITGDPVLEHLTRQLRLPPETDDKERFSELKWRTLPHVTPYGTFSYRKSDRLLASSGLAVVNVDRLDSTVEAEILRRQLFDDAYLYPALYFISPSKRSVKASTPYLEHPGNETPAYISRHIPSMMNYVGYVYGDGETRGSRKVDPSSKNIVRSCFLYHDPNALFRI